MLLAFGGRVGQRAPDCRRIAAGAGELGELPEVKSLTNRPGLGVEAVVNVAADAMIGRASTANSAPSGPEPTRVLVGRPSLLSDEALAWPDGLLDQAETLGAKGITVVAAGWDGQVRGLLSVADSPPRQPASDRCADRP
jgi:Cu+-exporting ATPase